jgi:hypothetical protein
MWRPASFEPYCATRRPMVATVVAETSISTARPVRRRPCGSTDTRALSRPRRFLRHGLRVAPSCVYPMGIIYALPDLCPVTVISSRLPLNMR